MRHVRDVRQKHAEVFAPLDDAMRLDRLCELNVIGRALNVCHTTIVQEA
ncbi:MAG: hypothetical protein OSA98_00975 [Rubripirellula sp.]|nr:hypothetical protein [Rubripirellula sp.]